jgi:DNA-binding GntR family transcriptional regulator
VSRTPIREALRELLNEGLVTDTGPRRQAVVATVSPELRREVFLLRSALERIVAREAAVALDVSSIDQLRLVMIRARRAIAAGDVAAFLDCDDEFHLHIARASGLLLVEDILRRLRGATRLISLDVDLSPDDLERAAAEHDALIEALDAGDAHDAEAATVAHLATSSEALLCAALPGPP